MLGKLVKHLEYNELEHFLTPYTKINLKWTENLNIIETIKLTEENTGKILSDVNHRRIL